MDVDKGQCSNRDKLGMSGFQFHYSSTGGETGLHKLEAGEAGRGWRRNTGSCRQKLA